MKDHRWLAAPVASQRFFLPLRGAARAFWNEVRVTAFFIHEFSIMTV